MSELKRYSNLNGLLVEVPQGDLVIYEDANAIIVDKDRQIDELLEDLDISASVGNHAFQERKMIRDELNKAQATIKRLEATIERLERVRSYDAGDMEPNALVLLVKDFDEALNAE